MRTSIIREHEPVQPATRRNDAVSEALTRDILQSEMSEEQATAVGAEVYIYGYPLVTMEMTRRVSTNTTEPAGLRSTMGRFAHARRFPPVTT